MKNTIAVTTSFQPVSWVLLVVIIVFMIGALVPSYFHSPIPTNPLEQLRRIANDRVGWTAQAVIFPVSFLVFSLIFGWITSRLPDDWPRRLALAATLFTLASFLLWLPISVNRIYLAEKAAGLIQNYDPAMPLPVAVNFNTFWLYTYCALAGIGLIGAALALAGLMPIVGWVIAVLTAVAILIGRLVWGDWPPFLSYTILLVMAIGLMRAT